MKIKFARIAVFSVTMIMLLIPTINWSAQANDEECMICLPGSSYITDLHNYCPTEYGLEYFTRGYTLKAADCMDPICSYYWEVLCSKEVEMPITGGFFIDKWDNIYTHSYCWTCGDV